MTPCVSCRVCVDNKGGNQQRGLPPQNVKKVGPNYLTANGNSE